MNDKSKEILEAIKILIDKKVEAALQGIRKELSANNVDSQLDSLSKAISDNSKKVGSIEDSIKSFGKLEDIIESKIKNFAESFVPEKGEKGEKGESGDSVDIQYVEEMVETVINSKIKNIKVLDGRDGEKGEPGEKGEKGEPGEKGSDGKDAEVDYEHIMDMLEEKFNLNTLFKTFTDQLDLKIVELKALEDSVIEKLKNVKDGVDGKDGQPGSDGKDGVDGKDGKDAEVDYARIETFVKEHFEPIFEKKVKEVDEKVEEKLNSVKNGKDGVDGIDGKDAEVDYQVVTSHLEDFVTPIILDKVKELESVVIEKIALVKDGKDGVNGKDGKDGKDALEIEISDMINPDKVYDRNSYAVHNGGLFKSFRKTDSLSSKNASRMEEYGWVCILKGISSINVEYDENTSECSLELLDSENNKTHKSFSIPTMIYKGVWAPKDEGYSLNNSTSYNGSLWISRVSNNKSKPGESPDWQLAVRKGRDGKDGLRGEKGEKGESGRDGKDLTQISETGAKY